MKKKTVFKHFRFPLLSKNVKGLKASEKQLKPFQFFNKKISLKGVFFFTRITFLESHGKNMGWWIYWWLIFFSHGWTNSCDVLVNFYGNINYSVKNKFRDNKGRVLVLDVVIDGTDYLLIKLYNGNTEPEQLKILESLSKVVEWFLGHKWKKYHFCREL